MTQRDKAAEARFWENIYEKPDEKEPDDESKNHWYLKNKRASYPAPGEEERRNVTGRTFLWMLANEGPVPHGVALIRACHVVGCIRPDHHIPVGMADYKPRSKASYAAGVAKRKANKESKDRAEAWAAHLERIS